MPHIFIDRVQAADTFSYVSLDFTFAPGLHSIEGGNGTSKSSLFLTLQQGFFNRNTKGGKVEAVNNAITGGPYEITIDFRKDSDAFQVVNSRKTGRIDIFKNGSDISMKRIPDNLALLQEILGCDFNMFCDLVYQNKESSLDLLETGTDKGRKAFINRVLRLAEIDEQAGRLKEKEKELTGKSGLIASLTREIEFLEASFAEPLEGEDECDTVELESRLAEGSERVASLQTELTKTVMELKEIEKQIDAYESEQETRDKIAALVESIGQYDPDREAELKVESESLQKKITALKVQMAGLETEISEAGASEDAAKKLLKCQKELESVDTGGTAKEDITSRLEEDARYFATESAEFKQLKEKVQEYEEAIRRGDCPTCGTKVPVDKFEAEVERLRSIGREKKERLDERKAANLLLREVLQAHLHREKIEREIETLSLQVRFSPEEVSAAKRKHAFCEERLYEITERLRKNKTEQDHYHQILVLRTKLTGVEITDETRDRRYLLEKLKQRYKDEMVLLGPQLVADRATLAEIKERNAQARARKEMNRRIAENNAEVQRQIDGARKRLEEAECRCDDLKDWAVILGDKGFRVTEINRFLASLNRAMQAYSRMICDSRIKVMFFISEGEICFSIVDDAKTLPFELWSAGEKARVKLICLFAVQELLETMGSVSFNILCLDEVFSELDQEGKAGLFKVLQSLKQNGKSIYTIAHSELALDLMFDSVIRTFKYEDGTTQIIQQ